MGIRNVGLWIEFQLHFDGVDRNYFYGEQYDSSVELLFNELPGSVKSFQTLN